MVRPKKPETIAFEKRIAGLTDPQELLAALEASGMGDSLKRHYAKKLGLRRVKRKTGPKPYQKDVKGQTVERMLNSGDTVSDVAALGYVTESYAYKIAERMKQEGQEVKTRRGEKGRRLRDAFGRGLNPEDAAVYANASIHRARKVAQKMKKEDPSIHIPPVPRDRLRREREGKISPKVALFRAIRRHSGLERLVEILQANERNK